MGIRLEKEILFIFVIPVWIAIRAILFQLNKKKGSKFSLKKEFILNTFFIYILCLISVTLFPLSISLGRSNNWVSVNLIPVMRTVKDLNSITTKANMHNFMIKFWIKNIVGNMILLFPLGVIVPMLWKKINSLVKITFFAFCLSLSIETLQLLSGYFGNVGRAFDIDDILLNTAGAMVGYLLYNLFINWRQIYD